MEEKRKILRNAAISSLGIYTEYVLGLIVSIWIARSLGPTEFGHYAFIIWLCGWLMLASNHALPTSAIKFIAEARGSGGEELAHSVGHHMLQLQIMSSAIIVALFLVGVTIDSPDDWKGSVAIIAVLVAVAVYSKAGYTMLSSIAKGYEQFRPAAVSAFISGLVNVTLVGAWSLAHGTVRGYTAIFAVLGLVLNASVRLQLVRY